MVITATPAATGKRKKINHEKKNTNIYLNQCKKQQQQWQKEEEEEKQIADVTHVTGS